MTKIEKSYIAGIIDGEGNISLTKYKHPNGKNGYCLFPTVQIANTNIEFLLEINELIKGKIFIAKRKIYTNHKPKGIIYFKGKNNVLNFLKEITPYLRIKKKQSEIVMKYCERRKDCSTRFNYSNKDWEDAELMKKLNLRGMQVGT